jgi:hypothetical protein
MWPRLGEVFPLKRMPIFDEDMYLLLLLGVSCQVGSGV